MRHRIVGLDGWRSLERRAHDIRHAKRQDDKRNDGDGDSGGSEQPPLTWLGALNHFSILGSSGGTVYPELFPAGKHTLGACSSVCKEFGAASARKPGGVSWSRPRLADGVSAIVLFAAGRKGSVDGKKIKVNLVFQSERRDLSPHRSACDR